MNIVTLLSLEVQGHNKVQASHPQTVRTQTQIDGNKKDVGVCLSRAYPYSQALALPLGTDKQLSSLPTPVMIYDTPRHGFLITNYELRNTK